MTLENAENLASGDALHLSNSMGVTENHADLRRGETLLRKLADILLNLEKQERKSHQNGSIVIIM